MPLSIITVLLKNYLDDRAQTVKLNTEFSEVMGIPDGVPQGSVLGPTLFICYINDIMHAKFNGYLNLYADDSSITVVATTPTDLYDKFLKALTHFTHGPFVIS